MANPITVYLLTAGGGLPVYVGRTKNVRMRWMQHVNTAQIQLDGISTLESDIPPTQAKQVEQRWIRLFNELTVDSLWNIHGVQRDEKYFDGLNKDKPMSFCPTIALVRAIKRDAKLQERKVADVIRLRLLQSYGFLPKETPCDSLPS